MAYSSILGADHAPEQPTGRDADMLGPSDNSDSGSDAVGTYEAHADSDAVGTGERSGVSPKDTPEGADILPDHIVALGEEEDALVTGEHFPGKDTDAREYTDLDASGPDTDADRADDDNA